MIFFLLYWKNYRQIDSFLPWEQNFIAPQGNAFAPNPKIVFKFRSQLILQTNRNFAKNVYGSFISDLFASNSFKYDICTKSTLHSSTIKRGCSQSLSNLSWFTLIWEFRILTLKNHSFLLRYRWLPTSWQHWYEVTISEIYG